MLHGLTQINLELTSRCDKHTLCAFCGHQDPEIYPTIRFGDMRIDLVERLAAALPPGIVVQFHRDGDPLAFPLIAEVLPLFSRQIRSLVTHGERLGDPRGLSIIGLCESVTVSIFRGDPDRDRQLTALKTFLDAKGESLPRVYLKVVGDMTDDELTPYLELHVPLMRRLIHVPTGNDKYAHHLPTMPEHGICLDLLHHPSISWDGRVYLCNRLDTADRGMIGSLTTHTLDELWNGPLRAAAIQHHLNGRRDLVPPCVGCTYYGVPTT